MKRSDKESPQENTFPAYKDNLSTSVVRLVSGLLTLIGIVSICFFLFGEQTALSPTLLYLGISAFIIATGLAVIGHVAEDIHITTYNLSLFCKHYEEDRITMQKRIDQIGYMMDYYIRNSLSQENAGSQYEAFEEDPSNRAE